MKGTNVLYKASALVRESEPTKYHTFHKDSISAILKAQISSLTTVPPSSKMQFKSLIALALAATSVVASPAPEPELEARDKIQCKQNEKAVCRVQGHDLFTILSDLQALDCVNLLNGNQVCVAL